MILDKKSGPILVSMDATELRNLSQAARDALAARDAAIVQAAHEGLRKDIVLEATGLSKERIRQIERAGGVPPRKAGRPRNEAA
jgi:hypothetical protein